MAFNSTGKMVYYTEFKRLSHIVMMGVKKVYKPEFNHETRVNETIHYYDCACAYDIETSSVLYNGVGYGVRWIWMFGINGYIFYGRTKEEYLEFYNNVVESLELSHDLRLIVFIHNASFDLSFDFNIFDWESIFSIDSRKPLYARTIDGVEFRCSYLQTGLSLAKLAKKCKQYPCDKKVGDLDYSLVRHFSTPIANDKEFGYCQEDIRILCNYFEQERIKEGGIHKLPLTKTGYVRRDMQNRTIKKSKKYREFIHKLNLNLDDYDNLIRPSFAGGFTHGSAYHKGKLFDYNKDGYIFHLDFTSSYPYQLLAFKYACSSPIKVESIDIETIEKNLNILGYTFTIEIDDLYNTFGWESYLSISHCKYKVNGQYISESEAKEEYLVYDNGRIYKANCTIETTITNIDWEIIRKVYSYSKTRITNCVKYYLSYLPYEFIDTILYYYEQKTKLKGIAGVEQEYAFYKEMCNSLYGFVAQQPITNLVVRDSNTGKWKHKTSEDRELDLKKYNENKNRTTFYVWSTQCTAYARANLWGALDNTFGILQLGGDFIYSDTDSIFGLHIEKYNSLIENHNHYVELRLQEMCKEWGINYNRCKPQNKKGKECLIGIWTREDDIEYYKFLGCKRYLYVSYSMDSKDKIKYYVDNTNKHLLSKDELNKISIEEDSKKEFIPLDMYMTVSGVNKNVAMPMLWDKGNHNIIDTFNLFDKDLQVPGYYSGKMMPTYTDEHYEFDLTDYTGITEHISEESGVYLESKEYTLSMGEDYLQVLLELEKIHGIYEEED